MPTRSQCLLKEAKEYVTSLRDLPNDAHSQPSEALSALIGPVAAAELLLRMSPMDSGSSPRLGTLYHTMREEPGDFIPFLGVRKTAVLLAALDLARCMTDEAVGSRPRITSAEEAIDYVCGKYTLVLRDAGKEYFYVVLLDIRNKVIRDSEISCGSISASVVDPADIVREACIHHASRVILVHNHPSGETDPSKEDIDTTNRIVQALKYVGVRVLDHVIVGVKRDGYFSFARAGMV
ncbi:MAG: JAB domain-containing protein [Candidatus Cryosericum sp.]